MECFDFVCRAPTNLFKSKYSHPPFLRVQSNLDSLILAAKCIDEEENPDDNPDVNINKTTSVNETLFEGNNDVSTRKIEENV